MTDGVKKKVAAFSRQTGVTVQVGALIAMAMAIALAVNQYRNITDGIKGLKEGQDEFQEDVNSEMEAINYKLDNASRDRWTAAMEEYSWEEAELSNSGMLIKPDISKIQERLTN